MRLSFVASLVFVISSFTGCNAERVAALEAQVKLLQAENDSLQEQIATVKKELNQANQELEQSNKLFADLRDAGTNLVPALIEKYRESLDVAKDLGLVEAQDFSIEDVLNSFFPNKNPQLQEEEKTSTED